MKTEPIAITRVAEFGATVIQEGEDGQPLAYLTAVTHNGPAVGCISRGARRQPVERPTAGC